MRLSVSLWSSCVFYSVCAGAGGGLPVTLPSAPTLSAPKAEVKFTIPRRPLKPIVLNPVPPRGIQGLYDDTTSCWIGGLIELFGGAENFGVVAVPDSVELIRLKPKIQFAIEPGDFIEEEVAHLSEADAIFIRVTLTSDSSYDWDGGDSECVPPYRYRVKFQQKEAVVCVDVCPSCSMIRVIRDGRQLTEKNIEYGAQALADIFVRYFPVVSEEEEANQALLPTSTAVTPAASHPSRQP